MPFGVWLLLHGPTRLADGFGHASCPIRRRFAALLTGGVKLCEIHPKIYGSPVFINEIRPIFFSVVFIHFSSNGLYPLLSPATKLYFQEKEQKRTIWRSGRINFAPNLIDAKACRSSCRFSSILPRVWHRGSSCVIFTLMYLRSNHTSSTVKRTYFIVKFTK